jgi:hypothetical protein
MDKCCKVKQNPESILTHAREIAELQDLLHSAQLKLDQKCAEISRGSYQSMSYYDANDLRLKLKRLAMEQL